MSNKKFSYATQTTTPCNTNAQRWYFINALQKYQTSKNPAIKLYYGQIANYYLNGQLKSVTNT